MYEFQMGYALVNIFLTLVLIAKCSSMGAAGGSALMTADQGHIASCVEAIAHEYFSAGRSVLVSMPKDQRDVTERPLTHLSHGDGLHLANMVLQKINENTCCPVQLFSAENGPTAVGEMNSNYIIFIWQEGEDEDVIDSLRSQLDTLRESEAMQWNPRGRFVVLVTDSDSGSARSVALEIYKTMWTDYNVIDNVIIASNSEVNYPETTMKSPGSGRNVLDLFSAFPYEGGNCGKVKEVSLMAQCDSQYDDTFWRKVKLFPPKIPNKFQNCVVRVSTLGIEPFVTIIENRTLNDGSTLYDMRGLAIEYFLLSIREMNMTVVFLPPLSEITIETGSVAAIDLVSGAADVLVGFILLFPVIITSVTEPSIPYLYDTIKWVVPCPKSISRVEKIITMFSSSVWLTMIVVLVLTSLVFWCSTNCPVHLSRKQANISRTIADCMFRAWGIFIGISVTEMPTIWKQRIFFLFYVCYCFSMSTVFQAFFVSYLVEPGYEKGIETFEELLDSSAPYGFNENVEFALEATEFTDHLKFNASRRVDCSDIENCTRRVVSDGDVATLGAALYVQYVASKFGTESETKLPCSLEENFVDLSLVSVLPRGSPILNHLNKFYRRCLEGGLTDKYWAEIKLDAVLKRNQKFDKGVSSSYFVFSLSHMGPVFSVLLFGCALSFVVFLAECLHWRVKKHL